MGIIKCTLLQAAWIGLLAASAGAYGQDSGDRERRPGAVYVSTNQLVNNEIVVFRRTRSGELRLRQTIATGGTGSQTVTESQDAVVLSDDNRFLFTVNVGSDDITVFRVHPGNFRLTFVQRVPSGGDRPVSLDVHEDLLYVVNSGITSGISGFRIAETGELTAVPGSVQPLSSGDEGGGPFTAVVLPCTSIFAGFEMGAICNSVGPAEVEFSPDGRFLVVSERLANQFSVYTVDENGVAGNRSSETSSGESPFGMHFDPSGRLIVAEAFLDRAGQAAASSYELTDEGVTEIITGSLPTNQASGCWMEVTPDGRYAYMTNPAVGNITGFNILEDGSLTLINEQDFLVETSDPRDEELSAEGRFLYVLNNVGAFVDGYRVRSDGTLALITSSELGALPVFSVGLAAF